jgi:hypothetical protein
VEALLSRTSIKSKDVALAVTEHGHRRSAGKQRLGGCPKGCVSRFL